MKVTIDAGGKPMSRAVFVRELAVRMLTSDGVASIWQLHLAAAEAHRRGQAATAAMLIEIADAAEREWHLVAAGQR